MTKRQIKQIWVNHEFARALKLKTVEENFTSVIEYTKHLAQQDTLPLKKKGQIEWLKL